MGDFHISARQKRLSCFCAQRRNLNSAVSFSPRRTVQRRLRIVFLMQQTFHLIVLDTAVKHETSNGFLELDTSLVVGLRAYFSWWSLAVLQHKKKTVSSISPYRLEMFFSAPQTTPDIAAAEARHVILKKKKNNPGIAIGAFNASICLRYVDASSKKFSAFRPEAFQHETAQGRSKAPSPPARHLIFGLHSLKPGGGGQLMSWVTFSFISATAAFNHG